MNRDDIELVVSKAIEFLKPSLKEKISLVEIFDLSHKIQREIQFEKNLEDESIQYCLSRADLDKIIAHGDLEIEYEDGTLVTFILEEDGLKTMTLENGGILVWYEGDEK